MKIQALYDLQQEVNRLFVAGSKFAKGDPRLSRYQAVLAQLGAKAPVFAKLNAELQLLLDTDPQKSAEQLLRVSTLLYAILYTQGDGYDNATLAPQHPSTPIDEVSTRVSYRQIAPVIEAFTARKSGRLETIRHAWESGLLYDFRLYPLIDLGLGDTYAEIASLVAEQIIPSMASRMLPYIKASYQPDGKAANLRRMRVVCAQADPIGPEWIEEAMASKVTTWKEEAVYCMGYYPQYHDRLLQLADGKVKGVAWAARAALPKQGTPEAWDTMITTLIATENIHERARLRAIIQEFKGNLDVQGLLNHIREQYEHALTTDWSKINIDTLEEEYILKATNELEFLHNKSHPKVVEFIQEVVADSRFKKKIPHEQATKTIYGLLHNLVRLGEQGNQALAQLATNPSARQLWGQEIMEFQMLYAILHNSATSVYNRFAPALEAGQIRPEAVWMNFAYKHQAPERRDVIFDSTVQIITLRYCIALPSNVQMEWIDPRWRTTLLTYKAKRTEEMMAQKLLLIALANNPDPEVAQLLIKDIKHSLKHKMIPSIPATTLDGLRHTSAKEWPEYVVRFIEFMPEWYTTHNAKEKGRISLWDVEWHITEIKNNGGLEQFPKEYLDRLHKVNNNNILHSKYGKCSALEDMIKQIENN